MKFLVMFALISLAASNIQDEGTGNGLIEAALVMCQDEAGVTIDFNELLDVQSETKQVQCMRFCMLKNLGMINYDGKIIADAAKKTLVTLLDNNINEEYAAIVINRCNDLNVSGDQCKAASAIVICLKIELDMIGVSR